MLCEKVLLSKIKLGVFLNNFNQIPRKADLTVCRLQIYFGVLSRRLAWVFIKPFYYARKYKKNQNQKV